MNSFFQNVAAFWQRRKWWIIGVIILIILFALAKIGEERSKPKDAFRAKVESHLSKRNGSHLELVAYIKASMNDPDSYEHVSTQYIMPKDTGVTSTIFTTTFRGKNKFGGVVTQTIQARCNINTGEVESIISK